jgi:hypothetical protein
VQAANLPPFLGRSIRSDIGPRTQAQGVFPTIVDDAGVPEVEEHGE